jgi:hypothetical protein
MTTDDCAKTFKRILDEMSANLAFELGKPLTGLDYARARDIEGHVWTAP